MGIFSFMENIQLFQAALLVLGLLFLLAEVFIPDFGIMGVLGIILFVVGIILTAETFVDVLVLLLILILFAALVVLLVIRSASKGRLSRTLVLKDSLSKEKGFSGVEDMKVFLGKEGTALTMLRPAGIGVFEGVRLDVVTKGAYIEKGTRIKITEVVGRRIVVDKIEKEEE
jgi:membrane-bound ClpP family serine protease